MVLLLVFISIAVHVGIIANTSVTARDSVGFARYTRNLLNPNRVCPPDSPTNPARTWIDVLRDEKHPPGYPALVAAVFPLVCTFYPAPPADQILRATQIASATSAVLLVLPAFWVARRLFGPKLAFWSVLLFQLLPVVARDTSDGLSDGPFLLFATAALAAGVGALSSGQRWRFLACGVWSGFAYLIRPEGVVLVLAAFASVLLWNRSRCLPVRQGMLQAFFVLVGFLLVGGPYMSIIRNFSNKPAMMTTTEAVAQLPAEPVAVLGPLFAEVIPQEVTGANRIGSAAAVICKEWLKVAHYGVGVLAIIGVLLTFSRVRTEPGFWFPLVYAAAHLMVLMILGYKQGYVSERHLLPITFIGVMFAVGGLPVWFHLWTRAPLIGPLNRWPHWPIVTVILLALTCLPNLIRPLHDNRFGHKRAGLKLAEELKHLAETNPDALATVVVIDHYEWAQFYSGRSLDRVPQDPAPENQRIVYAILELKDGQPETAAFHSKRHQASVDLFNNSLNRPEWIYTWPDDAPRDQARVVLLKQIRK
jgi:hypothetical protein